MLESWCAMMRPLRFKVLVLMCFILSPATAIAQDSLTIQVRPTKTYLRTNADPDSADAIPINLASLGIKEGDTIKLEQLGTFTFYKGCPTCTPPNPSLPENAVDMVGVFSRNSSLLPSGQLNRVLGAIPVGMNPVFTGPTLMGNLPTDIVEDFQIPAASSPLRIEVPSGAKFLFVAAQDSYYGDNADSNNDFAVRLHFPSQPVTITLMAPLPLNGDTFVITPEPKMPVITAKAAVTGLPPGENAKVKFTWSVTLSIRNGSGQRIAFDQDIKQNKTTKGDQLYVLELKKSDMVRGGDLTLIATAKLANGQEVRGQTFGLMIWGQNPQRADMQAYMDTYLQQKYGGGLKGLSLADLQNTTKRIACQESGQSQFQTQLNGIGLPLIDPKNGVGLFQITRTTKCPNPFAADCLNAVFNWKLNAQLGIVNLAEKVNIAKQYPKSLSNDSNYGEYVNSVINPQRRLQGLELIPLKQNSNGIFVKLQAPEFLTSGSLDLPGRNQLLEDAIRGNNGYSGGLHEFTTQEAALVTLTLNELKTDAKRFWRIVLPAERPMGVGDPSYVSNVRTKTQACN